MILKITAETITTTTNNIYKLRRIIYNENTNGRHVRKIIYLIYILRFQFNKKYF